MIISGVSLTSKYCDLMMVVVMIDDVGKYTQFPNCTL